jgi:GLPGLI family protein
MKLLSCFLLIGATCFSQTGKDVLKVSYTSSSKHFNDWTNPKIEEHVLLINGDKAIYQSSVSMKIDSLRINGKYNVASSPYFTYNTYAIEIEGNQLTYYNTIFRDEYQYEETLDFEWKLYNEVKEINGYSCKMAKVNYGNRNWVAWYTAEVPLPYGPYKFGGLPGLIVKLYDSTYSYEFELLGISKIPQVPLKKLYHKKAVSERIGTTREEFHVLLNEFNSLSFNDRINFKNTGRKVQLNLSRKDGNNDQKKFRESTFYEKINFIEVID